MFVHPDNQKLLWDLINKNTVFIEKPLKEREYIFKNAMQVVYNDNIDCVNDRNRLNELNKSVIYLMKSWIHKVHIPLTSTEAKTEPNSYIGVDPVSMTPLNSVNTDESRKYVYNDPYPKPNLKPEDIIQKIEDKPIQNIDELIQKQKMEREHVNVFRNENYDGKCSGRYEGLEDIIRKVIDDFYEKNMKKDFENLKNEINTIKNYIKSDENTN